MSRALALAALSLVLAACGAAGGSPSPGGPSPTPVQVLTEADSGRTVALAVGQTAALRLSNRYTWSDPQATGGAVRVTRGDATAAYHEWTISAAARGTATVTSGGRVACSPGAVCPGAILAFTLTVTVT
ncbi:MAG TPA: hypothetical protein VOB72_22050 [Candidatus Dormibacteraeota bacterium]|nr:hypothetical protein [Candidatus Dormibacteraeota bacterium]